MAIEGGRQRFRPSGRVRPKREREEELLVWPDLVFVEFIAAVLFTLTFIILAVFINAPLLNEANPDVTPNPSKAPWYFGNLQELLLHMHPAWAGVILPTIALGFWAAIPYIDRSREGQGVWFGTLFSVRLTAVTALYASAVTWLLVLFDAGKFEYIFRWIPGCDISRSTGELARHQWPPCLVDTASGHQGLLGAADFQTRLQFTLPVPRAWASDGGLDWPRDFDNIPWPFIDWLEGASWKNFHLWGGEHLNLAAAFAEQILPLGLIAFFTVLIIYVLFRVGWVRSVRDVMIVMFTAMIVGYLWLTIVASFFRGAGQELILPTDIKVDEG